MTSGLSRFLFLSTCLEAQGRCHSDQPTLNLLSVLCVSVALDLSVCALACSLLQTHARSFQFTVQLTRDTVYQDHNCCLNNGTVFECYRTLWHLKQYSNKPILKIKPWGDCLPNPFIQSIISN